MNALSNPIPKKQKAAPVREKTAREKAMEFAKNVPKPKVVQKKDIDNMSANGKKMDSNADNQQHDENEFVDAMGGTGTGDDMVNDYEKGGELNELAQKHDAYADELEKIKQMLM